MKNKCFAQFNRCERYMFSLSDMLHLEMELDAINKTTPTEVVKKYSERKNFFVKISDCEE